MNSSQQSTHQKNKFGNLVTHLLCFLVGYIVSCIYILLAINFTDTDVLASEFVLFVFLFGIIVYVPAYLLGCAVNAMLFKYKVRPLTHYLISISIYLCLLAAILDFTSEIMFFLLLPGVFSIYLMRYATLTNIKRREINISEVFE